MLKAIRIEKGLSQKQLADMVGISQPSYSNIENGKRNPTVKTLKKIVKALNCNIEDLLEEDKEVQHNDPAGNA